MPQKCECAIPENKEISRINKPESNSQANCPFTQPCSCATRRGCATARGITPCVSGLWDVSSRKPPAQRKPSRMSPIQLRKIKALAHTRPLRIQETTPRESAQQKGRRKLKGKKRGGILSLQSTAQLSRLPACPSANEVIIST
jgi:hypothetical protein